MQNGNKLGDFYIELDILYPFRRITLYKTDNWSINEVKSMIMI